jgi:hypothetical protein
MQAPSHPPPFHGNVSDEVPLSRDAYVTAISPPYLTSQAADDFFTPFLNPDFPIDLSLPMQLSVEQDSSTKLQPQAPLMQVAQTQRHNPKLVGKRKIQAVKRATRSKLEVESPVPEEGCNEVENVAENEESGNIDKRQKRLVKNRQAAQLFRKRQKQYISDLEAKVADVTNRNIGLTAKVDVLAAENKLLKDQLCYLRTFVVSALQQAFPPNKWESMQQQLGDIGLEKDETNPQLDATTLLQFDHLSDKQL